MNARLPLWRCLLLCTGGLAGWSSPCAAGETSFRPSLAASARYDDNVTFARREPESDLLLILSPSLRYGRSDERTKAEVLATADLLRYREHRDLDEHREFYRGDVSRRAAERLEWRLEGEYRRDSTLESELTETGVVTNRDTRKRFGAEGGVTLEVTDRSKLAADYAHSRTIYGSPELLDYGDDRLTLSWERRLTDRGSTVLVRPEGERSRSILSTFRSYGLSLGWASVFSETVNLKAFLGAVWGTTEYSSRAGVLAGERKSASALQADLSLTRRREISSWTVGFRSRLAYGAFGEPVQVQTVYADLRRSLTPYTEATLRTLLHRTWSADRLSRTNARHGEVTASIDHRFAEHHVLSAGYSYTGNWDRRLEEDRFADRNRAWLTVTFSFPAKW